MGHSTPRALVRLVAYVLFTLPLMPVQALLLAAGSRLARHLPHHYHRIACRILGIEIETFGTVSPMQPTLFVANHVSYLDIEALSAVAQVCFVAKREVAGWPLFGWLARLQRTVFIDRRSNGVAEERDGLALRLEEGESVVLFAEGTSGDGNRVKPFKSSLFSVAERAVHGRPLVIQPVSVAYTRLDGMPIGRQWRPFFAWYGAMDLAPHLWSLLGLGRLTATLIFHPPVTLAEVGSRKALAAHCQRVIAAGLEAANSGRVRDRLPGLSASSAAAAVG
jgi:lyso-ornithine lipid O-acyltransferase